MTNYRSSGRSSYSGRSMSSTAKTSSYTSKSSDNVSSARLHQKSGSSNSFGGITKVNHGNGTFSMRKTGK